MIEPREVRRDDVARKPLITSSNAPLWVIAACAIMMLWLVVGCAGFFCARWIYSEIQAAEEQERREERARQPRHPSYP